MRRAESSLMAYARQFAPVPYRADEDFSMELIDTHIPKSVVPLKNPNEKCHIRPFDGIRTRFCNG